MFPFAVSALLALATPGPGLDRPALTAPKTPRPAAPSYRVETRTVELKSADGRHTYAFEFPVIPRPGGSPGKLAKVQAWLEAYANREVAEAQKALSAWNPAEGGFTGELHFSTPIQSERLLVLLLTESTYFEGAAHGLYGLRAFTWDLTTQRRFDGEGSPFAPQTPEQTRTLDRLIGARLPRHTDFQSLKAHPPAGWYPSSRGLTLFWAPYQIGPFSDGAVETEYAEAELRPYLRPEILGLLNRR